MLLTAARVLTPARILAPGWVVVDGDRVVDAGAGEGPVGLSDGVVDDAGEATLVPGFVDTHVHGGGGSSFDAGPACDPEAAVAAHLSTGTTATVASLVTADHPTLLRSVASLAALADDGVLAGVHLEGPWLSPEHAGAHDPLLLTHPDPQQVDELVEAGRGHLRMVTLAPELPGALDAVRRLVAAGVVVGIGHTAATYDETRAALDEGARVGTHLFNAMRGLHHREPGPVGALLEDPDAVVELVADGVHLHPTVLRLAAQAKPGRTTLVTDAMAAAAAADGEYRLGRLQVRVDRGVARLDSGVIAGSTLTMAAALRYAVAVAGLPLEDVVLAATATPALTLGLDDVGQLVPGARADLVVLGGDLAVQRVMHRGRWLDGPAIPATH